MKLFLSKDIKTDDKETVLLAILNGMYSTKQEYLITSIGLIGHEMTGRFLKTSIKRERVMINGVKEAMKSLIDKGIISYYYPVFRPKNADSNFLLRRLNHGMKAQLAMAAEGTGQHVLAHGKFKNMEFLVPSIQEQEQIGAYFEKLDNLITLHQRESIFQKY